MKCPQHYLTEMQEVILFYNGLEVPTRQILDSKGVIPTKTVADAKVAIQEMVNEKVYAAQVGYELCKGPHYTKEYPLKKEGKCIILNLVYLFNKEGNIEQQLWDSTKEIMQILHRTVKHPKGIVENVLVGIGDEKIIFKSVKPASSFIKKVYMLSLRERMELDLEARLMRDQVNDLRPTIEECEVFDKPMIKEVKTRNDDQMVSKIIGYPSYYDQDEKIRIDYAYNLKFSCMIGFELVHANFFLNLPVNVMSKKFYNSIMKDIIKFRGRNELGNFANVPVFIGNFYVITDFIVVEDMDPYLDEGMGDMVVGEPLCKASCIEARRFDGIITIHDEDDTVSEEDNMNRISHPYQKLKGFYKGVLNLKPDFIRDAKIEEWLTCGHISVHEME
ncbi:hypothetical protein Tco_0452532 [Tanacetum coccineum]